MSVSGHHWWLRTAILFAIVYFVAGTTFGALANMSASGQMRAAWRLAAWFTCGAGFVVHIAYEHFRLRHSPLIVALHTSAAVALGAFGLAAAANIQAQSAASSHQLSLLFSLVAWPAITALPGFVVALVAAALLSRTRRNR